LTSPSLVLLLALSVVFADTLLLLMMIALSIVFGDTLLLLMMIALLPVVYADTLLLLTIAHADALPSVHARTDAPITIDSLLHTPMPL
jgi:hypothetical protein